MAAVEASTPILRLCVLIRRHSSMDLLEHPARVGPPLDTPAVGAVTPCGSCASTHS